MPEATVASHTALDVVRTFVDGYAKGDVESVATLLHPDVHEREIVPGAVVDQHGRDAVVAEVRDFLAPYGRPEILINQVEAIGPVVRWSTRWRLRKESESWIVEWHAFVTTADGLITALDIVCSGLLPES